MTDPVLIDRIILQGRALVRAIEVMGTIEPMAGNQPAPCGILVNTPYGNEAEEE